jgi:hypothetical protein
MERLNGRKVQSESPNKVLRAILFTLVPAAYLSAVFWRPDNDYGPAGRRGMPAGCYFLMVAVFLVSLLCWNVHRIVAALGLVACVLWLVVLFLPVL